jgi:DNA-binding transcriptional regulator of glucitol operon
VRRLLLSPSWLVRHLLALGLVVAFILLGRWQWHRAESGNGLSFAYTVEWPLFAAFVAFFWWKMLHFELHPPQEQVEPEIDEEVAPAEVSSQQPPIDDASDPELAAYNRYLADLDEQDRK